MKPNIVLIQNDHQAYYRHGFDGGVRPQTPCFDSLQMEGASFTNAYCTTPLCAPTRRTMLTGEYPHAHKHFYNYNNEPFSETYLEVLKKSGYESYYYGKWHAGSLDPLKNFTDDFFSCEGYGNPYISDRYKEYLKQHNLVAAKHKVEWAFTMDQYEEADYWPKLKTGAEYSCEGTWCGEHAIGETITDKRSHESFFLSQLACDKLEELASRNNRAPFALRVDFWGPHQPFFPTREFIDMYDVDKMDVYKSLYSDLFGKPDMYKIEWNIPFGKGNRLVQPSAVTDAEWKFILSRVYAHITMVDQAGGMILQKIKKLGLDKNTIVIWTSDHGDSIGSHGGHFDKGSHMCEEVMRIPFAIKWEDVIEKGVVCDELISTIDTPVTILAAAGVSFKKNLVGRNVLDAIQGEKWRTELMSESFGHGHGEFHISKMVRYSNYKFVYHHEEKQINELYNLLEDPYEMENLYYNKEFVEIKNLMITKLKNLLEESDDPIRSETYYD